jgi:hypothetical protein
LPLSHGLRAIKGFADDVGMASMLGGFGNDVEQCAACGTGRSGLEPGGRWERVAGVEVREVQHELIGAVGDRLVTVEKSSEGLPVTHLELGGSRFRVPDVLKACGPLHMNSTHAASVALTCLMIPPMLSALTVGVAAACASVRPCVVWRRKLRWAFNVSRRSARSAVVVGIGTPCARGERKIDDKISLYVFHTDLHHVVISHLADLLSSAAIGQSPECETGDAA